ncbi:MAG TPA: HAMP domain-containing histidine kinase [Deltaproteobacteria bacterium]|nr:HAMP domain-containing histidine kinase [Deltaproteobacteria bacterium]
MSSLNETPITALVELSRDVADAEDPVVIATRLADAAKRHLGASVLAVYATTDAGALALAEVRGCSGALLHAPDPTAPDTWVDLLQGVADVTESRALPLTSGGGLYGVLLIGWRSPPEHPAPVLSLAEGLADIAAIGLDRAYRTRELVRSLRELADRKEELARTEGLRRMGQMAAVLAHEVRNPMAGIRGVLELLQDRFEPGSPEHTISGKALHRLAELNLLVEELLQFARPRQPHRSPIPLLPLLQEVVSLLEPAQASSRAPEITIIAPEGLIWPVDPGMLARMLTNLLQNAVQATSGSGRIEIGCRSGGEGEGLELWVSDEGPGVPEEHRETLFEPFVTTKARGTGLGLAVCRQIAEAHQGTIQYRPAPSGGACFVVWLGPLQG